MFDKVKPEARRVLAISTALIFLIVSSSARATDYTWNADNTTITVAGSWLPGGGPPGTGDTGTIGGGGSLIRANSGVGLAPPADTLTILTNGQLYIQSSIGEQNIVFAGGRIVPSANWTCSSTLSMASNSTFLANGKTFSWSGLIQDDGGDAGKVIISNSSGVVKFTRANNTYSGGTELRLGTFGLNNTDCTGTGDVVVYSNATLTHAGVTLSTGRLVMVGGKITTAANYNLNAQILLKVDTIITCGSGKQATLSGLIRDFDGSNAGKLIKEGAGKYSLTKAGNTYTGGTELRGGNLGISATDCTGTNDVEVYPGTMIIHTSIVLNDSRLIMLGGSISSAANYTLNAEILLKTNTVISTGAANAWLSGLIRDFDGNNAGPLIKKGGGKYTLGNAANSFSGGLVVQQGTLFTGAGGALGTGDILIHTNATLDFNNQAYSYAGSLGGIGTAMLGGSATITVGGVSPGTNDTTGGTLTISEAGTLAMTASATSTCHLASLSNSCDVAVFSSATANLTINGALTIVNLGTLEAGDYTLFDLNGGTISGAFTATNMPEKWLGSVSTASGDVVLTVTAAPPKGIVITIR